MLKPLKKNALVQTIEKQKETESGIILASADPMEVTRGVVIAIGTEVTEYGVGDEILPNWQRARPTKFEGEDYFIVNEEDVVAVFEKEESDKPYVPFHHPV